MLPSCLLCHKNRLRSTRILNMSINNLTLDLNHIALELSDEDITDVYEAGGDD